MHLHKATVQFERPVLDDVEGALARQFKRALFGSRRSIAVAVGSRGIANIARIVRQVVTSLRGLGYAPFIVPAMGSHGGATAAGQAEVLGAYEISERNVGCPIRSSMEVVEIPAPNLEHRLYMDRCAFEADGILLVNRIKPHTDFHGTYESGLVKMSVIGLGKERQALEMHHFGVRGLRELVPKAAAHLMDLGKIVAGLAIIENAYDETALLELIPANQILAREPALLEDARRHLPRLPLDDIDVLLVDELGKNVSGCGMDTNLIGRIRIPGEPEPVTPRIRAIVVNGLTPESHGNATGLGLADVISRRFFQDIDFPVTYRNIVTSSFLERGKTPIVAENAKVAFAIALRSCGGIGESQPRVLRIRNTLHVSELYVSPSVLPELKTKKNVTLFDDLHAMFDSSGELVPFPT